MQNIFYILKGILLGFSIAAPVGPIGLLCIRRTLGEGRLNGLLSGLGAATADAIYGSMAAFGLVFVTGFLVGNQSWIRLFGGFFLLYLGLRTFFTRPAEQPASGGKRSLAGAYLSTFLLTLSNPATILSFIAIFAGLGLSEQAGDRLASFFLVVGVFCGSALWWIILSTSVSLFRTRITAPFMVWINRLSGVLITGFGIFSLAAGLIK